MDIGKEAEEPIQAPIPGEHPIHRELPEPATNPVQEPAKEPAHARSVAELDQAVVDACQSVARQLRSLEHG